jgi:SOS-response transcriptional repressor LexA
MTEMAVAGRLADNPRRMKTSTTKRRKAAPRADVETSAEHIDLSRLIENLKSAMAANGLNPFSAAKKAGVGKTFITDIMRRTNRNPSLSKLRKVAKALNLSIVDLAGIADAMPIPNQKIPISGIAEAGAFRPMPEVRPEREDELPTIVAGRFAAFASARHFGFEVRGDSMNAATPAPIAAGSIALCVDMVDAELTIETGRIYLVRRTLDGGQTYEHTIKRAHVFRDRIELRPESTNPKYQAISIPRGAGDEVGGSEIVAIGLVYGVSVMLL